ncbi:MAG: AMP-binding protein [Candidatus Algichlamydia australiensis]|nr:AMP-binding protein [Chlamydiales bacterium]
MTTKISEYQQVTQGVGAAQTGLPSNIPLPEGNKALLPEPLSGRITTEAEPCLFLNRLKHQETSRKDEVAATSGTTRFNYYDLGKVSNLIAHYLVNNYNIKKNSRVGIIGKDKLLMVVCELAVLKAGGAFVPFDSVTPKERLDFTVENAELDLMILCSGKIRNKEFSCETLSLEKELQKISKTDYDSPPQTDATDKDLAYILYTSGSTSKKPKGVKQTRGGLLAQIEAYTKDLSITENDSLLQLATLSHDQAIVDTFAALLNGASLHFFNLNKDLEGSREKIRSIILDNKVSIFSSIPSLYRIIFDDWQSIDNSSLRIITIGGEAVEKEHATFFQEFIAPQTRRELELINGYGASECSWIAYYKITGRDNLESLNQIPLGKITSNMKVLIDQSASPNEGIGELLISSNGVSPGYWNNREADENAFTTIEGVRYYRTGDFVTQDASGIVHFKGRKSWHVKINGERVNLNSVENALLEEPLIWEAKVIAHESGLHAFFISDARNGKLNPLSIRESLSQKLKSYEIPSFYHHLNALPKLPNGKVDRQQLLSLIPEVKIDDETVEMTLETFIETKIKKNLLYSTLPKGELNLRAYGFDSLQFATLAIEINRFVGKNIVRGIDLIRLATLREIQDELRFRLENYAIVDMSKEVYARKEKVTEIMNGNNRESAEYEAEKWDFYDFNFNAIKIILTHFANEHKLQIFPTESKEEFFEKIEELTSSEEEGQFGLTFPASAQGFDEGPQKNNVHYTPCILRKFGEDFDLYIADSVGKNREEDLLNLPFSKNMRLHFDPYERQRDSISCYIDLVLYFLNALQLDMAEDSIKLDDKMIQTGFETEPFSPQFKYNPKYSYFLSPLEIIKHSQTLDFIYLLTPEKQVQPLKLSENKESAIDYVMRHTKKVTYTKTRQLYGNSPDSQKYTINCSFYLKSLEFAEILEEYLVEKPED